MACCMWACVCSAVMSALAPHATSTIPLCLIRFLLLSLAPTLPPARPVLPCSRGCGRFVFQGQLREGRRGGPCCVLALRGRVAIRPRIAGRNTASSRGRSTSAPSARRSAACESLCVAAHVTPLSALPSGRTSAPAAPQGGGCDPSVNTNRRPRRQLRRCSHNIPASAVLVQCATEFARRLQPSVRQPTLPFRTSPSALVTQFATFMRRNVEAS